MIDANEKLIKLENQVNQFIGGNKQDVINQIKTPLETIEFIYEYLTTTEELSSTIQFRLINLLNNFLVNELNNTLKK